MSNKSTFDTAEYWESRYQKGRNSGPGSYSRLAKFKSSFLNCFLTKHSFKSVFELGCGDGSQLEKIDYPSYVGFDISRTTVDNCIERFEGDCLKEFYHYVPNTFNPSFFGNFDLGVSLDVIYHLSNDKVYDLYLEHLFSLASRFVIIYSNSQTLYMRGVNEDAEYVRFRKFDDDIKQRFPDWSLVQIEPNFYPFNPSLPNDSSFADFYIYKKGAEDSEKVKELDNSVAAFTLKKLVQKQMVNDEQTDVLFNEIKKLSDSIKRLSTKSDEEKLIARLEGIQSSLNNRIDNGLSNLSSVTYAAESDFSVKNPSGFDPDLSSPISLDFSNEDHLKG